MLFRSKQRAYERQIRKAKRQVESTRSAVEATADKDLQDLLKKDLEGYKSKLRNKQDALDNFCKENDLYRRRDRESIVKKGANSNAPAKKPRQESRRNMESLTADCYTVNYFPCEWICFLP